MLGVGWDPLLERIQILKILGVAVLGTVLKSFPPCTGMSTSTGTCPLSL
jgi:hypothetical protein